MSIVATTARYSALTLSAWVIWKSVVPTVLLAVFG